MTGGKSLPRMPPLLPTGTARASFQGPSAAAGDRGEALPRELRAALAAHDVSDELLWAAWEVTQWVAAAPAAERRALACLVVALLVAVEGGGTCLRLRSAAAAAAAAGEGGVKAGGDGSAEIESLIAALTRLGICAADAEAAGGLATRLAAFPSAGPINTAGTKPARTKTAVKAQPPGAAVSPIILALFDLEDVDAASEGNERSARRPFVVRDGALYPERLWWLEKQVVALLAERLSATLPPLAASAGTEAALREIQTSPAALPLADEQLAAVRAAIVHPLTLVAGGPGTGKTSTVVALLRTLVRLGVPPEEIALAAPTGRAAQRMKESVDAALARLDAPAPADLLLASRFAGATTLHRLLGIRPNSQRPLDPHLPEFYADWRLPQSIVIVDEASMIDLLLMEQLCAAVAPAARLVLIGDVDQLPSVQVGAVFRDLVAGAPAATCRLTRSHRMNPIDPAGADILRVAAAVNAGQPEAATALVARPRASDLRFSGAERVDADALDEFLERWHREVLARDRNAALALDRRYVFDDRPGAAGGQPDDDDADGSRDAIKELLETVLGARILCLTRTAGRVTSTTAINRLMHARVQAAALERGVDDAMAVAACIPGEPVIVLRNAPARGLANGDLGVVLRLRGARGGDRPPGDFLGVAFPRGQGFEIHPLDSISADLALAFALTVHKAQGSEFHRVALVLPDSDVPLLTREVLYTALTRARHSVVVVGAAALLTLGASRGIDRLSGLADKLARLARSPGSTAR